MLELALPLHHAMYPAHGAHAELSGDARENAVIGEVLAKIAERHSTRESYMDDARKDLEEARAFVQAKHLLTLAPALQPASHSHAGIHARHLCGRRIQPGARPGAAAGRLLLGDADSGQLAGRRASNPSCASTTSTSSSCSPSTRRCPATTCRWSSPTTSQPSSRRLLRAVFGNGPYIEGWGQYSTQMMLDEGFLDHSPEMALTFAKEELRVDRQRYSRRPPADARHDRPGGARPDGEADLPGARRGRRQAAARQALVLPVAHVLRGLARMAAGT